MQKESKFEDPATVGTRQTTWYLPSWLTEYGSISVNVFFDVLYFTWYADNMLLAACSDMVLDRAYHFQRAMFGSTTSRRFLLVLWQITPRFLPAQLVLLSCDSTKDGGRLSCSRQTSSLLQEVRLWRKTFNTAIMSRFCMYKVYTLFSYFSSVSVVSSFHIARFSKFSPRVGVRAKVTWSNTKVCALQYLLIGICIHAIVHPAGTIS